ncbi:MAG TPA: fatty acid desaturase [Ferrovibrio sp.]|uniref:fatty acid desaturase n=1 Tax=Ferrovibrio sp. TaxID=1917215 RepID=UPI002ED61AC5
MALASPRILSGTDLRQLSQRSDWRGALRIGIHLALLIFAGALVAVAATPWQLWPAMLLLGLVQAALFAPLHETMHATAFASRRANAIVGWLAGCPSLMNWHFYAAFHLAHHSHTQDPARDPELTPPAPRDARGYVLRVLAVNYWRARCKVIADAWRGDLSAYPYIAAPARLRIVTSVRWMCVFAAAAALGSALLAGWRAPLIFWIGPQLLGQPFLRLYLLTEHTGCTHDANGLTNTRTTLTNPLLRLLMWNMSFHAEHHLYPSIPFHRLPAAHRLLRERLAVVQPGYTRWHRGYFRQIMSADRA